MRLTILNQFYLPDISPTAQLAASLAEHRAELGDEVTVVAGRGKYAGASDASYGTPRGNLRVCRVWTPQLGKVTTWRRCLEYGAYYGLAAWRVMTLPPQDVVIALTTPPYLAWLAAFHKLFHRHARVLLWNMDCYPEAAERLGAMKPGGWLSRAMRATNRALFRWLDHVVCLDGATASLLRSRYAKGERYPPITVIPNWEEASSSATEPRQTISLGDEVHRLRGRFLVLYAGNMGRGHSFETLLEAAETLRAEPVTFLFVGGGAQSEVIRAATRKRDLPNVVVQDYVAKQRLRGLMAAAHCGLITLRDEALGVMSPSKLHANLAMGLPVIYVGPTGSNVDEAIRRYGCGVSLRHGDVSGMVGFIRAIMAEPGRLARLETLARQAFETAYNDERTLPQFDAIIDRKPVGPVEVGGKHLPRRKAA